MKLAKCKIDAKREAYKAVAENELIKGTSRNSLRIKLSCSDRFARSIVAEIAQEKPVVFLSQAEAGYQILPPRESLTPEWVAYWETFRDHTVAEIKSRMKELNKRVEPLERW
ncbi:MAG: hypothetical protein IKT33_03435 [Clostridia bacterium]|nr:hypothetical protein [Clostridia bacterium]